LETTECRKENLAENRKFINNLLVKISEPSGLRTIKDIGKQYARQILTDGCMSFLFEYRPQCRIRGPPSKGAPNHVPTHQYGLDKYIRRNQAQASASCLNNEFRVSGQLDFTSINQQPLSGLKLVVRSCSERATRRKIDELEKKLWNTVITSFMSRNIQKKTDSLSRTGESPKVLDFSSSGLVNGGFMEDDGGRWRTMEGEQLFLGRLRLVCVFPDTRPRDPGVHFPSRAHSGVCRSYTTCRNASAAHLALTALASISATQITSLWPAFLTRLSLAKPITLGNRQHASMPIEMLLLSRGTSNSMLQLLQMPMKHPHRQQPLKWCKTTR